MYPQKLNLLNVYHNNFKQDYEIKFEAPPPLRRQNAFAVKQSNRMSNGMNNSMSNGMNNEMNNSMSNEMNNSMSSELNFNEELYKSVPKTNSKANPEALSKIINNKNDIINDYFPMVKRTKTI